VLWGGVGRGGDMLSFCVGVYECACRVCGWVVGGVSEGGCSNLDEPSPDTLPPTHPPPHPTCWEVINVTLSAQGVGRQAGRQCTCH